MFAALATHSLVLISGTMIQKLSAIEKNAHLKKNDDGIRHDACHTSDSHAFKF